MVITINGTVASGKSTITNLLNTHIFANVKLLHANSDFDFTDDNLYIIENYIGFQKEPDLSFDALHFYLCIDKETLIERLWVRFHTYNESMKLHKDKLETMVNDGDVIKIDAMQSMPNIIRDIIQHMQNTDGFQDYDQYLSPTCKLIKSIF